MREPDRAVRAPEHPLTGCLVRAAEPGGYLLTVVLSPDPEASGGATPVGTAGTARDPIVNSAAYRLTPAGDGLDLAAHVGHTVEVTPAQGDREASTLAVTSLRVVADRCE